MQLLQQTSGHPVGGGGGDLVDPQQQVDKKVIIQLQFFQSYLVESSFHWQAHANLLYLGDSLRMYQCKNALF